MPTIGKLGRHLGRSEIGSKLQLKDYLTGDPFPPVDPKSTFDGTCGVTNIHRYLGNDQFGDCVFASYTATNMWNAWLAKEQPAGNAEDYSVWPTDNQVVTAYFTYEGSPNPTDFAWSEDNGYDQGADPGDAALWFTENEIGPLPKLGAFATVDDWGEEWEGAIRTFGSAWDAILVNSEMQTEYGEGQPWSSTATDWVGGHMTACNYRDPKEGKLYTWSIEQPFTWPNYRVTREQSFVLFTQEQAKAPGGIYNGVAVAQLVSDTNALKKEHGISAGVGRKEHIEETRHRLPSVGRLIV